jgi:hypothetical protein
MSVIVEDFINLGTVLPEWTEPTRVGVVDMSDRIWLFIRGCFRGACWVVFIFGGLGAKESLPLR